MTRFYLKDLWYSNFMLGLSIVLFIAMTGICSNTYAWKLRLLPKKTDKLVKITTCILYHFSREWHFKNEYIMSGEKLFVTVQRMEI